MNISEKKKDISLQKLANALTLTTTTEILGTRILKQRILIVARKFK